MEHLRRGTLIIVIGAVLVAALVGYYFANIYEADPSIRGTLVEAYAKEPVGTSDGATADMGADIAAYMDLAGVAG